MAEAQTAPPAAGAGAGAVRTPLLKRLYVQVLIGTALGVLLGLLYPSFAADLRPLSDAFI